MKRKLTRAAVGFAIVATPFLAAAIYPRIPFTLVAFTSLFTTIMLVTLNLK